MFGAQGVNEFFFANDRVALKIAKLDATKARMIRLQLKPTPRSITLASRTRALIFYIVRQYLVILKFKMPKDIIIIHWRENKRE